MRRWTHGYSLRIYKDNGRNTFCLQCRIAYERALCTTKHLSNRFPLSATVPSHSQDIIDAVDVCENISSTYFGRSHPPFLSNRKNNLSRSLSFSFSSKSLPLERTTLMDFSSSRMMSSGSSWKCSECGSSNAIDFLKCRQRNCKGQRDKGRQSGVTKISNSTLKQPSMSTYQETSGSELATLSDNQGEIEWGETYRSLPVNIQERIRRIPSQARSMIRFLLEEAKQQKYQTIAGEEELEEILLRGLSKDLLEEAPNFDPRDVAATLDLIADLGSRFDLILDQLIASALDRAHMFTPSQLASTLTAIARFRSSGIENADQGQVREMVSKLAQRAGEVDFTRPSELSLVMHALQNLQYHDPKLHEAFHLQLKSLLDHQLSESYPSDPAPASATATWEPQDMALVMYALAWQKTQILPDRSAANQLQVGKAEEVKNGVLDSVLRNLAKVAFSSCAGFTFDQVTMMLWSMVKLGFRHDSLMMTLLAQAKEMEATENGPSSAQYMLLMHETVVTMSERHIQIEPSMMERLFHRTLEMADGLTTPQLCRLLAMLGGLDVRLEDPPCKAQEPGQAKKDRPLVDLEKLLLPRAHEADPQAIADALQALAGWSRPSNKADSVDSAVSSSTDNRSPDGSRTSSNALSKSGSSSVTKREQLLHALEARSMQTLTSYTPQQMAATMQTLLILTHYADNLLSTTPTRVASSKVHSHARNLRQSLFEPWLSKLLHQLRAKLDGAIAAMPAPTQNPGPKEIETAASSLDLRSPDLFIVLHVISQVGSIKSEDMCFVEDLSKLVMAGLEDGRDYGPKEIVDVLGAFGPGYQDDNSRLFSMHKALLTKLVATLQSKLSEFSVDHLVSALSLLGRLQHQERIVPLQIIEHISSKVDRLSLRAMLRILVAIGRLQSTQSTQLYHPMFMDKIAKEMTYRQSEARPHDVAVCGVALLQLNLKDQWILRMLCGMTIEYLKDMSNMDLVVCAHANHKLRPDGLDTELAKHIFNQVAKRDFKDTPELLVILLDLYAQMHPRHYLIGLLDRMVSQLLEALLAPEPRTLTVSQTSLVLSALASFRYRSPLQWLLLNESLQKLDQFSPRDTAMALEALALSSSSSASSSCAPASPEQQTNPLQLSDMDGKQKAQWTAMLVKKAMTQDMCASSVPSVLLALVRLSTSPSQSLWSEELWADARALEQMLCSRLQEEAHCLTPTPLAEAISAVTGLQRMARQRATPELAKKLVRLAWRAGPACQQLADLCLLIQALAEAPDIDAALLQRLCQELEKHLEELNQTITQLIKKREDPSVHAMRHVRPDMLVSTLEALSSCGEVPRPSALFLGQLGKVTMAFASQLSLRETERALCCLAKLGIADDPVGPSLSNRLVFHLSAQPSTCLSGQQLLRLLKAAQQTNLFSQDKLFALLSEQTLRLAGELSAKELSQAFSVLTQYEIRRMPLGVFTKVAPQSLVDSGRAAKK
eukprot:g52699.t1